MKQNFDAALQRIFAMRDVDKFLGSDEKRAYAHEVFDENPIDTILDSKPIGGYEKETASPITACKVFDELTAPILDKSPSIDQLLGKVDYDSRNAENDRLLKSVGKGGCDGENNSPTVGHKVCKEMSYEFSVKAAEEIDGAPRVFDPGSKSTSGQCHSIDTFHAIFLGQCKTVISVIIIYYIVFIFNPGGCGEPFGFWIEGVVGMLYCHLLECLVRCLWYHIICLVDELNRADTVNEECCKLFCMINGVVGSLVKACKLLRKLLIDYIFWTRGALNLDDVELVHLTFGIESGIVPKIVVNVGLHFQRSLVEFSQEGLSEFTNMGHLMCVWLERISFSYQKAAVQRVIYKNIQSYNTPSIKQGQVLVLVSHSLMMKLNLDRRHSLFLILQA